MRAIPVRAAISMKIVAPNIAEGGMYNTLTSSQVTGEYYEDLRIYQHLFSVSSALSNLTLRDVHILTYTPQASGRIITYV